MKYGYARVSSKAQSLDLQLDALEIANCDQVYSEKISSRKKDRPELQKLLRKLKKGDTLVCFKLDRLGRSLLELVNLISDFEAQEIRFISLSDGIDTDSSGSKLLLNIMMCIADFEREMIRERTICGLAAAKKRGVKLGRPKGLSVKSMEVKNQVEKLYQSGRTPTEIQKTTGVSRPSVYKYLALSN